MYAMYNEQVNKERTRYEFKEEKAAMIDKSC